MEVRGGDMSEKKIWNCSCESRYDFDTGNNIWTKLCKYHNTISERSMELEQENTRLREMLWFNHGHQGHPILYGDDGEMQCNTCRIDFKRDSAEEIQRKVRAYNELKYSKEMQALKEAGDE